MAGLSLDLVLLNAINILRQLRLALRNPMQMGSLPTIGELVERSLDKLLPADAHELCSNRLGVSLTKLAWPLENRFLSAFRSRRQLIEAICAGCFIPVWSGALVGPELEGSRFIDGAYSDNSPSFADRSPPGPQLSPFASQVEVSPKGESYLFKARVLGTVYLANWNNVIRTWHAMLPFQLAKYRPYLVAGHRDMKEYLFRMNLVKCRQCHASEQLAREHETKCDTTQAASEQSVTLPQSCLACLKLLERVDSLQMSERLLNMLHE